MAGYRLPFELKAVIAKYIDYNITILNDTIMVNYSYNHYHSRLTFNTSYTNHNSKGNHSFLAKLADGTITNEDYLYIQDDYVYHLYKFNTVKKCFILVNGSNLIELLSFLTPIITHVASICVSNNAINNFEQTL